MNEHYDKIVLPNGVRILAEHVPYIRSASVGIWVGTGSRNESPKYSGAAHFIEHMLFKGTVTRTATDLANLMDEIGGHINAFTSKELTCFHGKVLDERVVQAVDILSDMFLNSKFNEKDIESERGVIFEEIDMYEDSPDELASERLVSSVYKGSSLSRPILGTRSSLSKMTGASLRHYMQEHYLAGNIVVSISGSYTESDINYIQSKFSEVPSGKIDTPKYAEYTPIVVTRHKPIEQNHICIGYPGCSIKDERRFTFQVMCNILGGGVSSRLFQKLREELGLCYSLYSYMSAHSDGGLLTLGLALSKSNEGSALSVLSDELKRFLDDGVTSDELNRSMEQVKTSLLLGLENTSTRMTRLGRGEITWGKVFSIDETIESYSSVTAQGVVELAREVFKPESAALSAVGKVGTKAEYSKALEKMN